MKKRLVLFDESGFTPEHIRSLQIVIWAVAFGTVSFNITGGIAMTGYLKSLGVSDFLYGILVGIGPAVGVLQIFASYLLERFQKRRAMFFIAGLIQRMIWLPFGLVPFLVPMSAPLLRIWLVSLFLIISAVGNPFISVTFYSLLADLTPVKIRGSYLGTRQRIATVVGILGGFVTAWLLDMFPGFNGYALVFAVAALFGTIDVAMFVWVKFPPMPKATQKESIVRMLSTVFKNNQFIRVVSFVTIWSFSLNLSAQFYLVYIRTALGMSNTAITLIVQIMPNIFSVIMLSRWGKALDKHGPRHVMLITARLSSLTPLLWFFVTPDLQSLLSVVLIIITYISTGLLLSGMDISSQNAFLNRSPERNRSMYVAIYFCITSLVGIALANATGGWLLDNPLFLLEKMQLSLLGHFFTRYNYLFLLTFILRIISAYLLLPRMINKEENIAGI